jgi:enoyl-CoA hydratase
VGEIAVESRDGIAVVRIDRPPANALDPGLVAEIRAVCDELTEDPPSAVVLAGRDRFFSAGLDLNVVPGLEASGQGEMIAGINRMVAGWYAFPRPVVCAVTGHAIAGGLILALCADYRIGATEGKLGLTEARVGVPYPTGAMTLVRAELPAPVVRVLVLRADLVGPAEALELGLLDELAEPAAVLERAVGVARELAELPADAYTRVKRQLRGDTIAALERIARGNDPAAEDWLSADTESAAAAALRRDSG